MSHVANAVAAIRKSSSFALVLEEEPITVEALQRDIDAIDLAWDHLDDELELARYMGDEDEAERIQTEINALEECYVDACAQLDMLRAAIALDAAPVH